MQKTIIWFSPTPKELLTWTTKCSQIWQVNLAFPSSYLLLNLNLHSVLFLVVSQSSLGSSRNAHWRHSPECVRGLLHRLDVKRMRIILFGYERVISRELKSVEKFSHKLEAKKCRCPCRQEVDVSVREFEAYPNEDRRVRRERVTNKHPSDSCLQTLKREGLLLHFVFG